MSTSELPAPLMPRALVSGDRFLFAVSSDEPTTIAIDDAAPVAMTQVPGTEYWFHFARLRLGTTHNYVMHSDGDGAYAPGSVAGYGPDSYPSPGAPSGTLSEMRTITSRIYGGAVSRYWVYTNPGVTTVSSAPVMIWLDGHNCVGNAGVLGVRMQTVTDNLVGKKLIPPMVHVLLAPSTGGSRQPIPRASQSEAMAMRSLQYDAVTDEFGRHLLEEVLPEVERDVPLRHDGYSRAIAGESSGGICSFKVCWFASGEFTRAHSTIGSYTALQWHPEAHLDGGYIFPFLVRREPRRNIRVWLSDGLNDLEGAAGNWPLANLEMAQALKASGYDYHFRYGKAFHNSSQAALDLPESLAWLWRDYDPTRHHEGYEQEAAERGKPPYRVNVVNRDAW
jgi:enterochelin esterase family protein